MPSQASLPAGWGSEKIASSGELVDVFSRVQQMSDTQQLFSGSKRLYSANMSPKSLVISVYVSLLVGSFQQYLWMPTIAA